MNKIIEEEIDFDTLFDFDDKQVKKSPVNKYEDNSLEELFKKEKGYIKAIEDKSNCFEDILYFNGKLEEVQASIKDMQNYQKDQLGGSNV